MASDIGQTLKLWGSLTWNQVGGQEDENLDETTRPALIIPPVQPEGQAA